MDILIWIFMAAIAIDNLTEIIVDTLPSIDLPVIKWYGKFVCWLRTKFPKLGKITECQYCQSFWLSGPVAYSLFVVDWQWMRVAIVWLVLHRLAQIFREFCRRYFYVVIEAESEKPKN